MVMLEPGELAVVFPARSRYCTNGLGTVYLELPAVFHTACAWYPPDAVSPQVQTVSEMLAQGVEMVRPIIQL